MDAEQSDFMPIPELSPTDSDLELFCLSANNVTYTSEVNDDWYAAHQLLGKFSQSQAIGRRPVFLADEPASILCCKFQYQTCDLSRPSDNACTKLASNYDTFQTNTPVGVGERIFNTSNRLSDAAYTVKGVVNHLGSSSLASRYTLFDFLQVPLPDNQWQIDVEKWHNIALASFQQSTLTLAAGPQDPSVLDHF